ncbi:MAG: PQQ-binding-like beta-propeller repeat protein, partial [Chloroflexota bacterium]
MAANTSANPPEIQWIAEAGHSLIAPPITYGRILLLATQPAGEQGQLTRLQAFDLESGAPRWEHDFEYAAISGMQAYYLVPREQDIAVVTASSSDFLRGAGSLLAFDEAGVVIWRAADGEDRYSAPVVKDRKVYVLAGSDKLLIVSPEEEGDNETRIPLDASVSAAAPLIMEGMAYIPCRKPELLAVELSGNLCWRFKYKSNARDWLDTTPAAADDRLFAVSSAGSVFALERASGELLWQISPGDKWGLSPPVVDGEKLYVGFKRGLLALDANNGRTLWTFGTERPVTGAALVFRDTLFVTAHDHHLYALDKVSGELRWSHEMDRRIEMPPVLASSSLLVVDRGGNIAAFDRPPEPEAPEPVTLDPAALKAVAEEHERQGHHPQAAELWSQVGDLERAAQQYEAGEAWLKAAETWEKLYRYNRRAEAYERYAQQVAVQDVGDEEKAAAWELAECAYRETTLREGRLRSETEVARYRQQPILELTIEHKDLVVETWSEIKYTIHNRGFGLAKLMGVFVKPERFETESTMSVVQPVIHSGAAGLTRRLQVRPLQKGDGVPMKFVVEYRDYRNQDHRFDRTFTVPVFSESDSTTDFGITGVRLSSADRKRYFELVQMLSDRLDMDELESLLFGLGLEPSDLRGLTRHAKARELVK